jgi:hypothetical protein
MTTIIPSVHGRINDPGSHLQVPASRWGEVLGKAPAQLGAQFAGLLFFNEIDEPEPTSESVWCMKGSAAPGA